MGEVMLDYAQELSTNPSNEVVIMIDHGLQDPKENGLEEAIMQKHADYIEVIADAQ